MDKEIKQTELKQTEIKQTEIKQTEIKQTEIKQTEIKQKEIKQKETKQEKQEQTNVSSIANIVQQSGQKQMANYCQSAVCSEGNKCLLICCAKECKGHAIVCADSNCKCYEIHQSPTVCQMINPKIIVRKIKASQINTTQLSSCIDLTFQRFVHQVYKIKDKLKSKVQSLGMTENIRQFFQLSSKGHSKQLTGQVMNKVLEQLNKQSKESKEYYAENLQIELQQKWSKIQEPIKQQILSLENVIDQFVNKGLPARDNQFATQQFHEKCDEVPHTATLAKTDQQIQQQNYNTDKNFMRFRTAHQMKGYEKNIVPLIKKLASKKIDNNKLLEILRQFYKISHPDRYKGHPQAHQIRFDSLMKLYGKGNQTVQILGEAADYMLNYKQFSFPIFESQKDLQYTFKKGEILYLVCSMALNLVPPQQFQDDRKRSSRFSFGENFIFIFSKENFRTQAIMEYLKQIFKQIAKNKEILNEKLTVRRQITRLNIKQLMKSKGKYPMKKFDVVDNKKSIEEYNGHIKVVFANQKIGGGVLHSGCFQEEIMFANRPQIITTMLFCQVMEPNESLFFIGFKKYFKNTGKTETLKYAQFEQQNYEMDERNRAKQYITAIDALRFYSQTHPEQMSKENIKRQILKAYTGFNTPQKADIITGNWGCGTFNGEVKGKFLIQWIACSLAGKQMIYCPFGSQQAILSCRQVLNRLQKMPVGQVYQRLISAGAKMKNMKQNIFEFISNQLD